MRRLVIILVLFVSISTCANAQYTRQDDSQPAPQPTAYHQQTQNFWDNVSIGGNFSLLFGDVTYIVVAPLINYHYTKNFVFGVGPMYQYYSINEAPVDFSSSIYGVRAVGMCFLPDRLSNIFLQAEYEFLNVPDFLSYTNSRSDIGIPLVGGGYRQPAGPKCYITLSILFDLSNSELSPYYSGTNSAFPIVFAGLDISL
jgi:hypothetical protein